MLANAIVPTGSIKQQRSFSHIFSSFVVLLLKISFQSTRWKKLEYCSIGHHMQFVGLYKDGRTRPLNALVPCRNLIIFTTFFISDPVRRHKRQSLP